MLLKVSQLHAGYDQGDVLRCLDFSLDPGELACVLGPSGCGKTTLLRCLAGFEPISSGEIYLQGENLAGTPPEQRRLGMVFQDYALFPHLTNLENIQFGIRKWPPQERQERLDLLMELTGLSRLGDRYPHEISGGQQQRVALARALAPKPDLILMDEPFSNLDLSLRRTLGMELRQLLKEQGTSVIMVTHDQDEAFTIADKIGLLKQGQLQQWASPVEVYHQPATPWVAEFIGQVSWLSGQINSEGRATTLLGDLPISLAAQKADISSLKLAIRPEDLSLAKSDQGNGKILGHYFRGSHFLYQVSLSDGEILLAEGPSRTLLQPGEKVMVSPVAEGLRKGYRGFPAGAFD